MVLAAGSESHQFLPYRPNLVLSDELNLPIVDFPGNHVGYVAHPAEFGTQLRELLLGWLPRKASAQPSPTWTITA